MSMVVIGAVFRKKRLGDRYDSGALPFQHCSEDAIALEQEAVRFKLRRGMAIADMPGEAHQMRGIGSPDFVEGLHSGNHFSEASVIELQQLLMVERPCLRQVKQNFIAISQTQHLAPQPPFVACKNERVEGGLRSLAGRVNSDDPEHDRHFQNRK